jgi:hypothetical protein
MKPIHIVIVMATIGVVLLGAFSLLTKNENVQNNDQTTDTTDWNVAADKNSLGNDYLDGTAAVTLTFEHVAPGEYSELYVTVTGRPGSYVKMDVSGPDIPPQAERAETFVGKEGYTTLTYRISKYGEYFVVADYENEDYSERRLEDSITVQ